MTMEEFNKLLKRYLRGQVTPEEEKQLEEWYRKQPDLIFPAISENEKKALGKNIWKKVRSGMSEDKRRIPAFRWWMGAAACLVAGIVWLVFSGMPVRQELVSERKRFEIRNTTGSDQEIMLSDSTLLILKQNSILAYENSFNDDKREVFLQGEAFFQVRRDEMKPFVVYAGNLITEVLGTSFRIRENKEDNTTEVSVTSGKVSVYADDKLGKDRKNGVILTANQQVSYRSDTQHITAGIVEEPVPQPDSRTVLPSLDFRSVPLQKVLDALTLYYGIEFVIANPKVKDCGINADLTGLSMFTQLELICKSIDAGYERRGTVVFINGDGC